MPLPKPAPFFALFTCLLACSNPTPATHPADTTKTASHSDTPAKTKAATTQPRDTTHYEDPEPSPDEILADYRNSCRDTVKIDTTVAVNGQPWHISFRHYSTGDSAIHLPDRYTSIYRLKNFTTSDFESKLKVTVRDAILIDTFIRKTVFRDSVDEYVANYGVLFFNKGIRFYRDHITLSYSYVIPLTDVGRAVSTDFY